MSEILSFLTPLLIVSAVIAVPVVAVMGNRRLQKRQKAFIDNYFFPERIGKQLQKNYPHLKPPEVENILINLRTYFHLCRITGGRHMVAMPSQAVDVAWHEFILFTKAYQDFCQQGLGRFLHHTPAEAMSSPTVAQDGIKVAWKLACENEGIEPQNPTRLPALFLLDAMYDIPDGFRYTLDCINGAKNSTNYGAFCASHIGCSGCGSGCGSDGDSGCGGGCGGD